MTSKRTQVSHPSFTQLIQSEKLTQNLEKNFNNPEQESSEEEELVFNKETRDVSPQPRPDLLAFLVTEVRTTEKCVIKETRSEKSESRSVKKEKTEVEESVNQDVEKKEEIQEKCQESQSQIVERKIGKKKENVFDQVCVERLKSSFSKFDKLQKKGEGGGVESCKSCAKPVFLVELIKAERGSWHRACFKCEECGRGLSVDSYISHEGKLYCKPHHRSLFLPKQILDSDQPAPKPRLIIVENTPVQLPPDVVRATDPVDNIRDELDKINVRERFEIFEKKKEEQLEPIPVVKRPPTVLSKLLQYENSTKGIPSKDLGSYPESEEEEPTPPTDLIGCEQLEQVREKWKRAELEVGGGVEGRSLEAMAEERKAEMIRFRSRLCAGKSTQLKQLYESGLDSTDSSHKMELDPTLSSLESSNLRKLFENGVSMETIKSEIDVESIEGGVGKEGRRLWEEMDRKTSNNNEVPRGVVSSPSKKFTIARVDSNNGDVVKSGCGQEEVGVEITEDLRERFKFFEKGGSGGDNKREFRITPEREGDVAGRREAFEKEAYTDPSIITTTPPGENQLLKSKTASKMLSVFRELEQNKEKPRGGRGLKEFTPPRDGVGVACNKESEDEEEEDEENDAGDQVENEKDAFLKEVGSLARARSLRAKFEKWEQNENDKNHSEVEEHASIESARILRKRFEEKMAEERVVKVSGGVGAVKRFVLSPENNNDHYLSYSSLTSLSSTMSDTSACAFCEKKVYAMEKLEANNKVYHKTCFRCSVCKNIMRLDAFTFHHDALYCKNHFKQLFKIKGNYDEGFGFETQKQIFAKKQAEKN